MGQCGGKSYTATCLFASGDFTMRGQKKHINESFSQSLSENWESKQWADQTEVETLLKLRFIKTCINRVSGGKVLGGQTLVCLSLSNYHRQSVVPIILGPAGRN